jgi:hypothetical protein
MVLFTQTYSSFNSLFMVGGINDIANHSDQWWDDVIDISLQIRTSPEKKALTRGSGAQIELFDEKNPEVENLVTGPL